MMFGDQATGRDALWPVFLQKGEDKMVAWVPENKSIEINTAICYLTTYSQ
jgi:hypothetical protein